MYSLTADDKFFQNLRELDFQLFLSLKAKPCPRCGGVLDAAHYPRKPRGSGEKEDRRFSLCCRNEACRGRLTPPSLRFFGRKIYSAWVVILALDFYKKLGLSRAVARQTLARWRQLWRELLAETNPFMRTLRGHLAPGISGADSPGPLLSGFGFPKRDSWIPILRVFNAAAC